MPASYALPVRVVAADLDEQAHVNNLVYVRWILDAATAHWVSRTTEETRSEVAWVILRHEIDYLGPALLDDELVVHTRVGPAEGLTFERWTEVRRVRDDRVLARSRSLWCPVNPRTGRPRRVSAELRQAFSLAGDAEGATG